MSPTPESAVPHSFPIRNIPYDVLHEIFKHVVPEHPFATPFIVLDTKHAPMMLCHVCSFWRMVALTSPNLWSHLGYRLVIQKRETEPGYSILKTNLEFLRWWKGNQGSIQPTLNFDVIEMLPCQVNPIRFEAHDSGWEFILNYLASARYLNIHPFYWELMRERQIACENMQTLALYTDKSYTANAFYDAQASLILRENHTTSPLQRLAIYSGIILTDRIIPTWSSLTRISMLSVTVSQQFWFSLIHAVPNLEWGCFEFIGVIDYLQHKATPNSTLKKLSALFVSCKNYFDISILFAHLYLPALQTLSLSSASELWADSRAMGQLHAILKRSPNVTTLALGPGFLSLGNSDLKYAYTFYTHDYEQKGIEPIWKYAPHLEHLQIALPISKWSAYYAGGILAYHTREILITEEPYPNLWLSLGDAACPIKSLTIVFNQLNDVSKDYQIEICRANSDYTLGVDLRFAQSSIENAASEERVGWSSRL